MRLLVCLAAMASSLVAPVYAGAQRRGQKNDKSFAAETKAPPERLPEYINAQLSVVDFLGYFHAL